MRVLVGYIIDGKSSGIDKYLLRVLEMMKDQDIRFDFLTNHTTSELKETLKQYGAGVTQIPSLKHPMKQYRTIRRLIQKYHYDVAYFNISEASNCMGVLAAHRCHVKKIVVHSHSSQVGGSSKVVRTVKTMIHQYMKHVLTRKATDYYACSEVAGQWMFDKKARSSEHYHVLYNAVNIPAFAYNEQVRNEMRAALGLEDRMVVGHVGSYDYAKNNFFLLDIIEALVPLQPNAVLLAVGAGKDWEAVKTEAANRGLDKYIIFTGIRSDVPKVLQAMDFFVLPSRFEGHPIAAIEAQITGMKTIISDTVTKEAVLSDYCVQLPINNGADSWAEYIVKHTGYERMDVYQHPDIIAVYDTDKQKKTILDIFSFTERK